MQITTNLFKQH